MTEGLRETLFSLFHITITHKHVKHRKLRISLDLLVLSAMQDPACLPQLRSSCPIHIQKNTPER
jgi:hypothetical protein